MHLVEAARWDPRFQFHWSVEPDLIPGKSFAEQHRTVSYAGARGDASGEDAGYIYTTHNFVYWATQFFYEEVDDFPAFLYLVYVKNGQSGTIETPHQDANPPTDVVVLAKVGEIDLTHDGVPDYGRMQWAAERWIKQHGSQFSSDE